MTFASAAVLLPLLFVVQEREIPLAGETHHVQGILVDEKAQRVYVTSVDRQSRKGFLMEYELPSGKQLRSIEIQQDGERFHPGGFDADDKSFWIPVAEYKRNSSAVIQKRNRQTLALEASFPVTDHIGCVAIAKNRLYGGNWDSKQIYEWKFDGKEIRKRDSASQYHYQDIKFRKNKLVAGGINAQEGAVEYLNPGSLKIEKRVTFGKTSRGVLFPHEGMDLVGNYVYFLPEDAPSRLFMFRIRPMPATTP
jgi:hypothetical protein